MQNECFRNVIIPLEYISKYNIVYNWFMFRMYKYKYHKISILILPKLSKKLIQKKKKSFESLPAYILK